MNIIAADDEEMGYEQLVDAIKEAAPDAVLAAFKKPGELLSYVKEHSCDVAFLDIEMGAVSGIDVAKQLKIKNPGVNIIFVTGYNQYMAQAFLLRTSGYVGKPVTKEKIREELENLRTPVPLTTQKKLVAKCFGTFDVSVNGESLKFERTKTKEMLAYLIDRKGNAVTSGELRTILWEDAVTDKNTGVYLQMLKKDLIKTLKKAGMEDVFVHSFNKYAVDPERISCDYYEFLKNNPDGILAYNGEYMRPYKWCDIQDVLDEDEKIFWGGGIKKDMK